MPNQPDIQVLIQENQRLMQRLAALEQAFAEQAGGVQTPQPWPPGIPGQPQPLTPQDMQNLRANGMAMQGAQPEMSPMQAMPQMQEQQGLQQAAMEAQARQQQQDEMQQAYQSAMNQIRGPGRFGAVGLP